MEQALRTISRRAIVSSAGATLGAAAALAATDTAPADTLAQRAGAPSAFIPLIDGAQLYYKDWGVGRPVVFSHGWPLTADAWEDAMFFLARNGFRCVAADRRGHGRSTQTWGGNDIDTYADDLAALVTRLDLRGAIHVGHSTGGGEVTRYIGRHGTGRVAGVVLVSSITPVILRSSSNPAGVPREVYDGLRADVLADRSALFKKISAPFYGANRSGSSVSQGVLDAFVAQSMSTGMPASYFGLAPASEVDFTTDLRRFDVPTLVVHGSDDQFVPVDATAVVTQRLVRNAKLLVYQGAPHGLPTTEKTRFNADLLAFARSIS